MELTHRQVEIPDHLMGISPRRLASSNDGRSLLVDLGIWSPEKARAYAKQQHRRPAKSRSGPFLALDGEGVTNRGTHRYVLLNASNIDSLYNPNGIPTVDALDFMLQISKDHPKHNHVMFGGSYDANMVLGDLPYSKVKYLGEEGYCHWGDYRIEYHPRKSLRIWKYDTGERHVKENAIASIVIWDVIGFFQTSFIKALSEWLSDEDQATVAFIEKMKGDRSHFNIKDIDQIRSYCIQECILLERMMEKMRNRMRVVSLVPSRWDGAGALASCMMANNKMRQYYPPPSDSVIRRANDIEVVQDASQYAYFGGRIEMVRYGNIEGPVYAHDINSAYPSVMPSLPCLLHGRWRRVRSIQPDTSFTVYHVGFSPESIDEPFFTLPWRSPERMVYFPPVTLGWYWQPEVSALIKQWGARKDCSITIKEGWTWVPECDHVPFNFVPGLYKYRRQLKNQGHHAHIVLKLGLNSLYGKLAQQVGSKDGKPPNWHNLLWAGYITSATRAKLYNLAMKHPHDVIAFETDGLYSTARHECDEGSDLGQWEVKEYEGITYVQSGVYWSKTGRDWIAKFRGFDPGTLDRSKVLSAWRKGLDSMAGECTRFQGMLISCTSIPRFAQWRSWITEPRTIQLYATGKRLHHPDCDCGDIAGTRPDLQLHKTIPTGGGGGHSTIHPLKWIQGMGSWVPDDPYYMATAWLAEEGED